MYCKVSRSNVIRNRPVGCQSASRRVLNCTCKATHYEVLGVSASASDTDIKRAFRKLALQLHPDVNNEKQAANQFIKVKEAYEVLSDDKQKAAYDYQLQRGAAMFSGSAAWDPSSTSGPNFDMEEILEIFESFSMQGQHWEVVMEDEHGDIWVNFNGMDGFAEAEEGARRSRSGSGASSSSSKSRASSGSGKRKAAGQQSSRSEGARASQGRGRGATAEPLEVLMDSLDEESQQELITMIYQLPSGNREALLHAMGQADSVEEVVHILSAVLGNGELIVEDVGAWSSSGGFGGGFGGGIEAELEFMTDAFWHKNAGRGGGPRMKGFESHTTFGMWEDAMERERVGRRGEKSAAGGRSKKAGRRPVSSAYDIGLEDIQGMRQGDLEAFVEAVMEAEEREGGGRGARRGVRRGRM